MTEVGDAEMPSQKPKPNKNKYHFKYTKTPFITEGISRDAHSQTP